MQIILLTATLRNRSLWLSHTYLPNFSLNCSAHFTAPNSVGNTEWVRVTDSHGQPASSIVPTPVSSLRRSTGQRNSAGFPQDRGEEEAERILPWLPGNIHHSYYSGKRITSCVHAYHRYHTLGNTMEVHHPLSGLIRCIKMLELGNQPWRTEVVAGYPVRTMFQQDETFRRGLRTDSRRTPCQPDGAMGTFESVCHCSRRSTSQWVWP